MEACWSMATAAVFIELDHLHATVDDDMDIQGSASLIANVGSALLCRRFASFSADDSVKSLLPELLCDL